MDATTTTLAALATPTVLKAARSFDRMMRRRDLRLFGRVSRYGDDHRFVERFCVLYAPIRSERGHHSTALFD